MEYFETYSIQCQPKKREVVFFFFNSGGSGEQTNASPNSTHCEDFSDKCALVQEARALGLGLDVIMCNTEENGGLLSDFCPVTCNTCMGK